MVNEFIDCRLEELEIRLHFEYICIEGNKGWFVPDVENALYEINLDTFAYKFITRLPGTKENNSSRRLVGSIIKYNQQLILTPMGNDNILVYDLISLEFESFKLVAPRTLNNLFYNSDSKVFASVRFKDSIFMVGRFYPAIIQFNMKDKSIKYHTKWTEGVDGLIVDSKGYLCRQDICVRQGSLFIALGCTNAVLEFNINNQEHIIHRIGEKSDTFSGIVSSGENFFLIPRQNGAVIEWNKERGSVHYYQECPDGFEWSKLKFMQGFLWENDIWIIPAYANMILKINTVTKKMECVKKLEPRKYKQVFPFYNGFIYNNKLYLVSQDAKALHFEADGEYYFDFQFETLYEAEKKINDSSAVDFIRNYNLKYNKRLIIEESEEVSLVDFIKYVSHKDAFAEVIKKEGEIFNCGRTIHNNLSGDNERQV